jgi:hypothetical protein
MTKLLTIFISFFLATNCYAENKRLHCKGEEVFIRSSDYRSSSERDFVIEFNEKKNYLNWNTYDFALCYINPSNKNKIVKSNNIFTSKSIGYECETHNISDNSETSSRIIGRLILDRYTGVMKTNELQYAINSKEKVEKQTLNIIGNFVCDLITNKKF